MAAFENARENIRKMRDEGGLNLRQIADCFEHLTYGDISRILRGIEPKDIYKRAELGLPVMLPAPICLKHGIVHVGRCPTRKLWYNRIADYPVAMLRRSLENRHELSPLS